MAMLDVSIALTNPYTLDCFNLLRRKQNVNQSGGSRFEAVKFLGVPGIIYPEGLADLSRRAEVQFENKSIVVISIFPMRGASEDADDQYQPDIIIWNGDNFLVKRVEDYSRFARGYVKVTAESVDLNDLAPGVTSAIQVGPVLAPGNAAISAPASEPPAFQFSDQEIPALVSPGIYSLKFAPNPPEDLQLVAGGSILTLNVDYTLNGNVISFINGDPDPTGIKRAWYRH